MSEFSEKHGVTQTQNADTFIRLVTSRRSVRVFDGSAIPEEVVNCCLDLALLAPNSSNLQPWEFYRICTLEKKKLIVEACLSQPAAATAAELIVCIARINTWRENAEKMAKILEADGKKAWGAVNYYKNIIPTSLDLGPFGLYGFLRKCVTFFRRFFSPVALSPSSRSEMILWATKTCALAAENLMLAFRAHGYDSCAMEGFDSRRVKKILNLPPDAYVVMIIGAGKGTAAGVYGPRIRFERENFIKEI